MRKWLWIIIGLVVVLVLLFIFPGPLRQVVGLGGQSNTPSYQTTPVVRGNLTAYVGATGSVRSNQTALLAWQTSGQVASVAVSKGQKVKKGDVLATLEQSSLPAALISAQADLITAQNNLQTVLDNSKPRADAELALAQAQKALDDAQKATNSKLYQNAGPNTIDIARANVITAQSEVDKWTEIYNRNASRAQDDSQYAAALSGLANARQKLQAAEYNLQYAVSLPDSLSVQTVYAQLDQAKANLLTAKQNWDKVKNGPNPDDIAAAQARVAAAQASLNQTKISAPFDGTVTVVNAKPGDRIQPGSAAFQLDDMSRLLIDVQVSEVDINNVKPGQPVDLTFDAIPDQTYHGAVTDISAIGTVTSGTVNFSVTVEVTSPDVKIKPGMTTTANIAVTQLTNVLLVPIRAVRVINNNQRVVYILRNGVPTPVNVTLGASDNVNTQIVSGDLREGEQVVLNPPATLNFGGPGGGGFFGGGGGGPNPGGGNSGGGSTTQPSGGATPQPSGGANGGQ